MSMLEKYDERTFETAFLEYGVMQELVRGTERKMWFLHDPVEDFPEYTWEDFRKNYLKTDDRLSSASGYSYLRSMPWPTRVFRGVYPKKLQIKMRVAPGEEMEGAKPIPESYAALLCAITQLLGDMDQKEAFFDNDFLETGLFMSDSGLYQRTFSDDVSSEEGGVNVLNERLLTLLKSKRPAKIQQMRATLS